MRTDIYKVKTDEAWNRLYRRLDDDHLLATCHARTHLSPWIKVGVAAVLLIAVVLAAVYHQGTGIETRTPNLLAHENQGAGTLATTLEDGSVVLLAKETSLLYPEHFMAGKREVTLQGNAFFDVAKKQQQPFCIDTQHARIEVLGTAFSVQSNGNASFRLSVQRGEVKVSLKTGNRSCRVRAGETVVLQAQQFIVSNAGLETDDWSRFFKRIRFKDESLANILRVMNLNSDNLQIRVASPALEERRLTVEFSNESPEVIAGLIAGALSLQCVRQGDVLLLSD